MEKYIKPEMDEIEIFEGPPTRQFWIEQGFDESMGLADEIMKIVNEIEPSYSLRYARHGVGPSKEGIPNNFIFIHPKKYGIKLIIRHEHDEEFQKILEDSNLDVVSYERANYPIRLTKKDIAENKELLKELIKKAYDYYHD